MKCKNFIQRKEVARQVRAVLIAAHINYCPPSLSRIASRQEVMSLPLHSPLSLKTSVVLEIVRERGRNREGEGGIGRERGRERKGEEED